VRASFRDPSRYVSTNEDGTANVLAAGASTGVRHVIVASSSSVYGDSPLLPFRESDPLGIPLSPYAETKVATERLCREHVERLGAPVTCLRLFSVFGPRQRPDLLIHRLVQSIECGASIPLYGDGSSSRDYTYVTDVVAAAIATIESRPDGFRVYNVGGGRSTSLAETVAFVEDATGRRARIERLPPQRGDIDRTWADIALAERDLGFSPRVELPLGIRRYVDWWRCTRGVA
jgi:UDP-glucuronate 4-epimerase